MTIYPSDLDGWTCTRRMYIARDVTLLALDLVDSTGIFWSMGDVAAYRTIARLFLHLRRVYVPFGGRCFKQVGDGEFQTYPDPGAALRAGLAMQARARDLTGTDCLTIGIRRGSCVFTDPLSARNRDYMGLAVNLTARLQSAARPGEIAFEESLLDAPEVHPVLAEHHELTLKPREVCLRGRPGLVPIIRLRQRRATRQATMMAAG